MGRVDDIGVGVIEVKDVLILRTSAEFPGTVLQSLLGIGFFTRDLMVKDTSDT